MFYLVTQRNYISKEKEKQEQVEPISNREIAIVNSGYNKHDIQRRKVREIWNKTMELLEKDINKRGLVTKHVSFAHSRPWNLKDLPQRESLYQNKDHKTSTYLKGSVVSDYHLHWPLLYNG